MCRFDFYLWVHLALAMSLGMSVGQSAAHCPPPQPRPRPRPRPATPTHPVFSLPACVRCLAFLKQAYRPQTVVSCLASRWGSRVARCVRGPPAPMAHGPSTDPARICGVSPDRFCWCGALLRCVAVFRISILLTIFSTLLTAPSAPSAPSARQWWPGLDRPSSTWLRVFSRSIESTHCDPGSSKSAISRHPRPSSLP